MLYLAAQEQESQIQGMLVDEAAIKEQQELLDSFKKGRPPTARRMQQDAPQKEAGTTVNCDMQSFQGDSQDTTDISETLSSKTN